MNYIGQRFLRGSLFASLIGALTYPAFAYNDYLDRAIERSARISEMPLLPESVAKHKIKSYLLKKQPDLDQAKLSILIDTIDPRAIQLVRKGTHPAELGLVAHPPNYSLAAAGSKTANKDTPSSSSNSVLTPTTDLVSMNKRLPE